MTRRDPVTLGLQMACLVLALVAMALLVARLTAAPPPACPAPDHPVWASTLQQWLCGDSLTVGVKSR
jgi:hypothetical protein